MTDEAAKALADAMNRLAVAIESLGKNQGWNQGGLHVHHHGLQPQIGSGTWAPPGTTWSARGSVLSSSHGV